MRIKIQNANDFDKLLDVFDSNSYNITGHLEDAFDGVWFVVDSITRKAGR
jgi:hypothetical protein